MKNKILVIGGNGFIGKNVVNNLLKNNFIPIIYDRNESNLPVEQYFGNLLEDEKFPDIVRQCNCVIYLITSVSPKMSMEDPKLAYMNDIPLLLKTLNVCLENKIKRVIYASSGGTVYGEGNNRLFTEDDLTSPINHYAICKLSCEKILCLYNKLYDMENVILRIANPYGIGQRPSSGVGAVTTFASNILEGKSITLFGDGDIYRDYVDVESVSDAFRLSCDWNFRRDITPIFNIGSGEPLSLNEIIDVISSALEVDVNVEKLPSRFFDVHYSALDTSKAEKYLKYVRPTNQPKRIKKYVLELKKNLKSEHDFK